MRKLLLLSCLLMPVAGLAASGDDFYDRLYQRGMAHFAAAEYAAALPKLRTAAFGFVDRVEEFEIAHSYACIAAHRIADDTGARDSLMRIVAAERVQPRYRTIKLPDDVRAAVNDIAANSLTTEEAALLGVAAAAKQVVAVPTPSKRPNVAVTAPRDGGPDAAPPANDPATTAAQSAPASSVEQRFADAQRAIEKGDNAEARRIYTALSSDSSLPHDAVLRVAEGLVRAHDFAGAAQVFARAGAIAAGEERYHYSYAVALYETGHFGDAKRELKAALPYITMTPDVVRYREKIEAAVE